MLGMRPDITPSFTPLFELAWIEMLAGKVGLMAAERTTAVDGGLHHAPQGSRSGWIHNDFCSGWFNGTAAPGQIHLVDRRQCDYFTGSPRTSNAMPTEYIRAATMIFYLANDRWTPGMGGETGLYSGSSVSAGDPILVPPTNNTLLLFECTPNSYHLLIGN
jgi:hypothetical protein